MSPLNQDLKSIQATRRVLLKLSGEALMGDLDFGI
jgi:uridylate kinase